MMHLASLAGMEAGLRDTLGLDSDIYHDRLIYGAMIQAGVQRLRIVGGLPSDIRDSNYLQGKCIEVPFSEYYSLLKSTTDTLKNNTIGKVNKSIRSNQFLLSWFLTELIYSLKTRSAMVLVLPMPDISGFRGALDPGLYRAINTLMGSMDTANLNLPVPRLEILQNDVKLFHELLDSDLFSTYANTHRGLEVTKEKKQPTVRRIISAAESLHSKFGRALNIKQLALSLIPVTASLIDTVCGKIPGTLADAIGNSLSDALKDGKRIIIYNYGQVHGDLLRDHYQAQIQMMPNKALQAIGAKARLQPER